MNEHENEGNIAVQDDECAKTDFEARFGKAIVTKQGVEICGQPNSVQGSICHRTSGWGTQHAGYGPCVHHGGISDDLQNVDRSYATVVTHRRLRELLIEEYAAPDVDNLDHEIILLKAIIRLLAENFAIKLTYDKDGLVVDEEEEHIQGFYQITEQSVEIRKTINDLSNTIKKKYQVMLLAQETIPRTRVRSYIGQILNILNSTLRNTCESCGHDHQTLNNVQQSLGLIGEI